LDALYEEKENFFDDIMLYIEEKNNFIDNDENKIISYYDEDELNKKMEGLYLTIENYKNKEEFDNFDEIE